jgi:hypothetical protein
VHQLYKENYVYGPFTVKNGRLTFRTGDAASTQRLRAERDRGRSALLERTSIEADLRFHNLC